MKKLLMFIVGLVIFASITTTAFAYPSTITVDAYLGPYDSQDNSLKLLFEPDTYEFSAALISDSWSSQNMGMTNLGYRGYFWAVSIYQPSSGATYELGDYAAPFTSASDALNNTLNDPSINTKTINHTSGGELWFYIDDSFSRDNGGSVTLNAVPIVPEPVSTTLFIIGGVVLGGRSLIRRNRSNK